MVKRKPTPKTEGFPGLEYLNSRALWNGKGGFNLETPTALLCALGNPQDKIPAVHVAGTNGKGSVCAMIAAMFQAEGLQVGQFTSPHLKDPTERCLINGSPAAVADFDRALLQVKAAAERVELQPSFFEIATAASFVEFFRRQLDWMVIEVGLGGRLDATNIMKHPNATLITNIGYDHTHILGSSLRQITREKAGIVKTGVPIFAGELHEKARMVLTEVAAKERAELFFADEETFGGIDFSKCSLRGGHQQLNARLAALVAKHLGLSKETIEQGLMRVRWPGRLELVCRNEMSFERKPLGVLLDAAHNIDGVNALCLYLKQAINCGEFSPKQLVVILAVLERKDWCGISNVFCQLKRELEVDFGVSVNFIFTNSGHSSCVVPEELYRRAEEGRVTTCPKEALDVALSLNNLENTLIVISGSIYLIGRVRPMVTCKPFTSIAQ